MGGTRRCCSTLNLWQDIMTKIVNMGRVNEGDDTALDGTGVVKEDTIGKIFTIISAILIIPLIITNIYRNDRRQYPSRATTLYMICVFGLHMTVIVGLFDTNRTTFVEFYETGELKSKSNFKKGK